MLQGVIGLRTHPALDLWILEVLEIAVRIADLGPEVVGRDRFDRRNLWSVGGFEWRAEQCGNEITKWRGAPS